jgi:hypothetical protein
VHAGENLCGHCVLGYCGWLYIPHEPVTLPVLLQVHRAEVGEVGARAGGSISLPVLGLLVLPALLFYPLPMPNPTATLS